MKVFPSRRRSRRAGGLPAQGVPVARAARPPADHPGRARRLHRLRRLRRRLPGQEQDRLQPQGHQHGAGRRAPRRRAASAGTSSSRIPPLDREPDRRTTRSRAAQVLEPLFEFSGACGGCGETPYIKLVSQLFGDRMIVANATGCSSIYGANLPTTPWTVNAAGPRPGVEQLAVRGQRRVRARDAPGARRPDRPGAPARSSAWRRSSARTSSRDLLDADQDDRGRDRRSSATASTALRERARTASSGRARADARHLLAARRRPRPPGRLDHRRRRLGLRHRLRRPRPRPVVGPQRQHPGPRHRGLLEHRRPGVEGDAARRRGQVRGRRQGHGQEGPRRDRPVLRQRLRRPGRDGRQRPADDQGAARGRRLAGPVAGHRLQHLHRPRHRHVEVDDATRRTPSGAATGRCTGSSRPRSRAAQPFKLDSTAPTIPIADFVATETRFAVLQRTHPERAAELAALAQADADERWRYYEQLAGIERTVPHLASPTRTSRPRPTTPVPATTVEEDER